MAYNTAYKVKESKTNKRNSKLGGISLRGRSADSDSEKEVWKRIMEQQKKENEEEAKKNK